MSTQLVPFGKNTSLAAIQAAFGAPEADEFSSGIKSGFAVLRIGGKQFAVSEGGETTIIMDPNDPDEPARKIEVVLLRAGTGLAKSYYAGPYNPDAPAEAPDCYSNDGIAPAKDAKTPQCTQCATCPKNEWGSKTNDLGNKVKACGDTKRVAVATLDRLDRPMLLNIPPMSFDGLKKLTDHLKSVYNLAPYAAVTQLSFDKDEKYPKLKYVPVAPVPVEMAPAIMEARESAAVKEIVSGGTATVLFNAAPAAPAPVQSAPAQGKKATKPAAEPAPAPVAETNDSILSGLAELDNLDLVLEANGVPVVPVAEVADEAPSF